MIDTEAITGIVGTLRSLDTEEMLFGGATPAILYPDGRPALGEDGAVRVTFCAADMASKGSRELQRRELTLTITHSGGKTFNCGVIFQLLNQRDVS